MMFCFHIDKKLFSKHNLNQIAKRFLNVLLCCVHSIFGIQYYSSITQKIDDSTILSNCIVCCITHDKYVAIT